MRCRNRAFAAKIAARDNVFGSETYIAQLLDGIRLDEGAVLTQFHLDLLDTSRNVPSLKAAVYSGQEYS